MTAYNISKVRSRESHGAFASHGDCQQAARGQLRAVVIRQGHFHPQHCGHCGDTIGDRDLHAVLCGRRAIVHVLQSISSDVLVGESVAFPKRNARVRKTVQSTNPIQMAEGPSSAKALITCLPGI